MMLSLTNFCIRPPGKYFTRRRSMPNADNYFPVFKRITQIPRVILKTICVLNVKKVFAGNEIIFHVFHKVPLEESLVHVGIGVLERQFVLPVNRKTTNKRRLSQGRAIELRVP